MKYINLELSNLIGQFEHTMVQVILFTCLHKGNGFQCHVM